MANLLRLTIVSVEYRLTPEHPHPAGLNDCIDAALFLLSSQGEAEVGQPLKILGGKSAGAYLSVQVALSLRRDHGIDIRSRVAAIVAGYGIFDVMLTPSVMHHKRRIILGKTDMENFMDLTFSHLSLAERKDGRVSPLFAEHRDMPPTHFLIGTVDPLKDDSIFMAIKWWHAGNETVLDIVQGAAHGFTLIPVGEARKEGIDRVANFPRQKAVMLGRATLLGIQNVITGKILRLHSKRMIKVVWCCVNCASKPFRESSKSYVFNNPWETWRTPKVVPLG